MVLCEPFLFKSAKGLTGLIHANAWNGLTHVMPVCAVGMWTNHHLLDTPCSDVNHVVVPLHRIL